MTKATNKLSISLLALLMLCLAMAHAAHAEDSFTLRYKAGNDGEYALTIDGLDGTKNVYAVQLELEFSGKYPDVRLIPVDSSVYSPDVGATENNGKTYLKIYLSSLSPINDGASLVLGTLYPNSSDRFSMPSTATLTLLDTDLSPIAGANGNTINVRSVSGNNGGSSSASRNSINIQSSLHGTVQSSLLSAQVGANVQLTVTPESGYELLSLSATDADGNELTLTPERSGVYSFRMPDSDVKISAVFTPVTSDSKLLFSDVSEGDWFFGAVSYVYENGMMNGTGDGRFSPALTTSRAMIVTILYRLEDDSAPVSSGFTDLQPGAWYVDAVGWASAKGVVSGYDSSRFGPDDAITREQLSAILYRYAKLRGMDLSASDTLESFTDAGSVSSYAQDAMRWAVGSGLISGKGSGILDPLGNATRAESAAILMRFCQIA